jgi:hypothetical protein
LGSQDFGGNPPGNIGGSIYNAQTGLRMPSLQVRLIAGANNPFGSSVATSFTIGGLYSFSRIQTGTYTAVVDFQDSLRSYDFFNVVASGGRDLLDQNGRVTPGKYK